MRLEHLDLEQFRCFQSRSLDLSGLVTVVYGDNGAGKSSLLAALAAALSEVPGATPERPLVRRDLRFEVRRLGSVFVRQPSPKGSVRVRLDACGASWQLGFDLDDTGRVRATHKGGFRRALEERSRTTDQPLPLVAIYPAQRTWSEGSTPAHPLPGRLAGYEDALRAGNELGALRAWWRREDGLPASAGLTLAVGALQRFLGSEALSPVWDPGLEDVLVHVPELGGQYALSELSDGYRNSLALLIDVARRLAQLNPALDAAALQAVEGFVAIDELDLHLHPRLQRLILPGLRAAYPGVQWLITTHSPLVLSTVERNEEVLSLSPERLPHERPYVVDRDANGVLLEMGALDRSERYDATMESIFSLIEIGSFDQAEAAIDELRLARGPDDAGVQRLLTALALER